MLEQAVLREQFQHLLKKEREAEQTYAELAGKITDARIRREVEQLRRDKQRHIVLTERLLDLVE
jgi:rubrerythrin